MGEFIATPFVKYKDFNECTRIYMLTSWHNVSLEKTNNFLTTVQSPELTFVSQMDRAVNRAVTQVREKLFSILFSTLFCCSHGITLTEKESTSGNLCDLMRFRMKAVLRDHMAGPRKNVRYSSVRIKNELMVLFEKALRDNIVKAANKSVLYHLRHNC